MASPKPSFTQRYLRFWAVTMLQRNRYHWQHLAVSYIVIRIMTSKLIRGKKTLPNLSWLELLIFIWIFNSIYLKHFIPSFHVSFTNCLLCHVFSIISVLQSFNLDYFHLTSIIFVVELHHMRHSTCMCWVHFGKNNSNWSICRLSIKKIPIKETGWWKEREVTLYFRFISKLKRISTAGIHFACFLKTSVVMSFTVHGFNCLSLQLLHDND